MKDRIIIEKNLIPYMFNILLADVWFELEVKYNTYADMFTVGLYKDDECLCAGEPLIYGKPLFEAFYTPDFPALTIIPVDEAGDNAVVTWENFGQAVFLSIYNDDDDTIKYSGENSGSIELYKTYTPYEIVDDIQKMNMETVIIEKGGTVSKKETVATFNELVEGVNSIILTDSGCNDMLGGITMHIEGTTDNGIYGKYTEVV